jgi:hypothetical protein
MRFKGLQVILILIVALASFCGTALAQTRQIYEFYNTGDDGAQGIYAIYWYGQTFNTTVSHTIDGMRLRLYKAGTAGYLYVGIRACNTSTGLPEGADLTSGVYDGSILVTNTSGSYREVTLTTYTLAANTQYAIICWGTGADASNGIFWRSDNSSPTYTGGYYISSSDDGITWTSNTSRDYMFELWGKPTMDVVGAQVYSGYLEAGDWLFVVNYINEVTPYYPVSNPENYWLLQLLDGSTAISSLPVQQWGQRPGSIYLSAAAVSSLEWGKAYTIRLYGNYGTYPYDSYTLEPANWIGGSWGQLDTWCTNLAHTMEDRDGVEYLTDGPEGEVLNTAGGAIFTIGIPWLPETRPGIFQYSLSTLTYTNESWANTYPNSLSDWSTWMGPEITDIANNAGDILHISGKWALGLFFFMFYLVVAGVGIFSGHITEGLVIASPLIILTMNWMIIPMALVATGIMLGVYKWLKGEWFERT